jgi:hypothetical protein
MAQIIVAIQMVTEQMFLERYDVPALLAVGLEGLFGMTVLSILMIPMYFSMFLSLKMVYSAFSSCQSAIFERSRRSSGKYHLGV